MKKKIAIAIFVKTPSLSSFKTRLSSAIGKERTYLFYLKSIEVTSYLIKSIESDSFDIYPYFAIAEKKGLDAEIWRSLNSIYQGRGGLGERLGRVYSSLMNSYDGVFFLGSDAAHIKYETILDSLGKLFREKNDFVMGRSEDGGFYLFGGRSDVEASLWCRVEYSLNSTGSRLYDEFRKVGKITLVEESFDIDTGSDLLKYNDIDTDGLLEKQLDFINWTKREILPFA